MGAFDNKMNNIGEEAKKGRSKLAAQAAAQDKKFRTDSNNQIKKITADTAAEFSKVRLMHVCLLVIQRLELAC